MGTCGRKSGPTVTAAISSVTIRRIGVTSRRKCGYSYLSPFHFLFEVDR